MPKLLQINTSANWGSTGRIAEQIGLLAIAHGWESYIAYGRSANPSRSILIKIGSKLGVLWHVVESRIFDNHGLASRHATHQLIKKIKEIQPDIIHLHNIHGYYLNYKILFEYLNTTNCPIVWTLHDCWSFTGHCAHYIHNQCEQWKTGCMNKECKRYYPVSYVSRTKQNFNLKKRLFLSLCDRLVIIPVSRWLVEQTKQSFLGLLRTQCIYNGVDTTVFFPQETEHLACKYKLKGKTVLMGVASSWSEEKGLSDFLALREKLPESYAILMVGLSDEYIARLPKGIIGIPRTQSIKELAELYSVADILLSLSRAETFGLTVAEGMACGTPSVVYNNTAVPELITPETGLVVDKTGDIDSLISSIKEMERKGKEHYSKACRMRAVEHFDKDKCFEKYIDIYNEILK